MPNRDPSLKQQAHELIDKLPAVDRWEDLVHTFAERAAVERGLEDAKLGRVVAGDDVMRWLESWGSENELPPPAIGP
jgi:predicted transcriptional regulator